MVLIKDNPQVDIPHLSWRDNRYKRFYEVVDQLVHEVQEHIWLGLGKRKRRVQGKELNKLHYSIECIVRDCIAVVHTRKRIGEASIYKGQYHYGANRPDQMLTYKIHVQRAFNTLKEMGYLMITRRGFYARENAQNQELTSQLTRFVATDKLLNLFHQDELFLAPLIVPQYVDPQPIKVKSRKKDEQGISRRVNHNLERSEYVETMSANLKLINKTLSKHWYDLELSNDQMDGLARLRAPKGMPPRPVMFERRSVYRVFNDPKLQTGGRFFGAWWQDIPSSYRHFLLINGKRTVEIDYSSMHPTILYAWAGKEKPSGAYSNILNPKKFPKDSYSSEENSMKGFRQMIERCLNAMLNSPKPTTRPPRKKKEKDSNPSDFGLTWKEVSGAILEFHEPIKDHFFSGLGGKLQRIDSNIAERTMLHFARMGIPVLPMHDSFIMHHGYEGYLREVMAQSFYEVVGVRAKIDIKTPDTKAKKLIEPPIDFEGMSIDEEFSVVLDYLSEGHVRRLNAFQKL